MLPQEYFAYLLRLRRVDNAGDAAWVITLQEPGTDREIRFADLIALITFLHETMGNAALPTVSPLRNRPSPPNF
ncbi:MAG TPA: hypothetical protein P5121_01200 [Caldilineaceae bacterium]|nr:hypothetical protein [Caldilineaceae bacterium]